MACSGDRHGTREGSVRELQANVPRAAGGETLREARRSEPALSAGSQTGRAGMASATRPCRNTTMHGGGAENMAPSQAAAAAAATVAPAHRAIQRGRAGTQSARHGLRSVGASMVVGKVNSVGALAGPSPRNAQGAAPSVQQPRGTLGDITNGQASRKQLKAPAATQSQQPLPTLLTSSASVAVSPAACCSTAGVVCTVAGASASAAAATTAAQAAEDILQAIFEGDEKDSQKVGEYAADIFARSLEKETRFLPKSDYMEGQQDVNAKMRAILIDWLVEVHMKYHLRPETLFLTGNIIDRYLSLKPVLRKKLQLLGVVAMLIAAKFEEIDPPRVHEFSYITDNTYDKREILNMEAHVLLTLGFQIAVPIAVHFIDRLCRANGCDGQHRNFVQYTLEMSLLDVRALRYSPSVMVAASVLLSNIVLGRKPVWPAAMAHCSKRSEASLLICAEELRGLMECAKTASLHAVRRKYQVDQRFGVSTLSIPGPGTIYPGRAASANA